jgi:hypothetical protein
MKAFFKSFTVAITAMVAINNYGFAGEDGKPASGGTIYPIRNIVVIFQENVSFDLTSPHIRKRSMPPANHVLTPNQARRQSMVWIRHC